jgi:hypothetical protein
MDTLHVFVAVGRFDSFEAMREFIDPEYDENGDSVPSKFIQEVGLTDFEPGCIEAIISDRGIVQVKDLLRYASYSDQWLDLLPVNSQADSAICVFSPNAVSRPQDSSLTYLGEYRYRA